MKYAPNKRKQCVPGGTGRQLRCRRCCGRYAPMGSEALKLKVNSLIFITIIYCFCPNVYAQSQDDICTFDKDEMLALDESAFDQDFEGGWRVIASIDECIEVAGDLIRDYREHHKSSSRTLFWHEGQMRAVSGDYDRAIALFRQSVSPEDQFGWNQYVNASIAFLESDLEELINQRDLLLEIPEPDFEFYDKDGNPMNMDWPPNLNVINGFINCFEKSYKEAYGNCSQ